MRFTLAAVAAALILAAPAQAHHSPTSRVHDDRHIAATFWGPTVCGGQDVMTVPITRADLPTPTIGLAFTDTCSIEVADIKWSSQELCDVLVHEFGHLAGWRAPEGQEFIRPDGTPDYAHSADPHNVMYPVVLGSFAPCDSQTVAAAAAQFPPST
jgi:hypothetical protein